MQLIKFNPSTKSLQATGLEFDDEMRIVFTLL